MSASTFHFSPRPNRAAEIRWRAWDDDAFRAAQAEDKPILLGISAVWCHWCHVMDETSYSDDQVIQLLNDRFITIRVDNDQRPDINARYNAGGWPTTAFLTPGGEVMAAMTYVPPEQMRDVLQQVSGYYKDNKQTIDERIAQIMQSRDEAMRSASGSEDALSDQILRDVLHTCADAYDPVFGGFGNEPKFPHTDAIDLLLHAYLRDDDRDALHMARKTMDYMCRGGTYDQEWGGCYRYSTKRDWSVPHYEKMLEDNALLLRNLLKLYRITGDELHRRYIDFTIAYLDTWLSDAETGVFYGSQDADEEFYPLPGAERRNLPAPYVDRTPYTSWNAMAAGAYAEASWTCGRPELLSRALTTLDYLWEQLFVASEGMHRYLDGGAPRVGGLLGDQAWMLAALIDAHQVALRDVELERARTLADLMIERLESPSGGFFDTPAGTDTLGRLSTRQKPVKENAIAALALIRLARLTHDGRYEAAARRALAQFTTVAESQGYFASDYAKAVDVLLNPGAEVTIVGAAEDGRALHAAALALAVPERLVRRIDPGDTGALARETLPAQPAPAAYACYGTLCSAPVTEPTDLIEVVGRTRQAHAATRAGEPLAVPRSEMEED